MLLFLFLIIIFKFATISAIDLKCDLLEKSACKVLNIPLPENERIQFTNWNQNITKLEISNCSTKIIPSNMFANFTKLEEFIFMQNDLEEISAGKSFQKKLLLTYED